MNLPALLTLVPGSCTASNGVCNPVTPTQVGWSGTLAAGEVLTITYQAQIADGTPDGNTATLRFDDTGYDAVPNQFAIEVQSPRDVVGQKLITVGLSGDLNEAQLTGAGQIGVGLVYNANENPFGSFVGFLTGTCQASATITSTNPRVPFTMGGVLPSGQAGTIKLNIGSGVGLLLTPQNATKWSGIRGLHKTASTFSTITIPLTPPIC